MVDKMTYDAANRLCVSDSNLIQETLAVAEGQGLRNHFYRKYARVYDSISNGQSFHQYQVKAMVDCLTREIVRTHKTSFLFEPLGSFDLDKEPYISLTTEEYSDFISFVFCNKGLGNRAPSKLSFQNGDCLACSAEGRQVKLNEPHILLECPRLSAARAHLGMQHAVDEAMSHVPTAKMGYAKYWGKTSTHSLQELRWRLTMASQLLEVYEEDTRNILEVMKGIQLYVLQNS